MNTNRISKEKQLYISPFIKRIRLDNQISLQLASDPPFGPGESKGAAPEHFNKDPFKMA